jgi:photosystem II stability/assembly factor-like uncharacterized protein
LSQVEREFNVIHTHGAALCGCGLFLLIVTFANYSFAQWRKIFDKGPANIVNVVAFNKWGIGFVGFTDRNNSYTSTLWKTLDTGKSWVLSTAVDPTNFEPTDFTFKDSLTGWIAGAGPVFETTDGGSIWVRTTPTPSVGLFSVYYNPANKLLFGGAWDRPYLIVSSDDGAHWNTANNTNFGYNGFSFLTDSIGIITNAFVGTTETGLVTRDGGLTWSDLGLTAECWQPFAQSNSGHFFAVHDNTGTIYRSDDTGMSWTVIYDSHDLLTGCIRGDATGNLFVQSDADYDQFPTMCESSDSGNSWTSICGPGNTWDTRFCLFSHYLFAGDTNGALWRLDLSDSKQIIVDSSLHVVAPACDSALSWFYFGSTYPCFTSVALDSVTVIGSTAFSAQSALYQQQGIDGVDSVLVHYQPQNSYDTAKLILHFVVNGVPRDSSVRIYGIGGPRVELSTYLKPTKLTTYAGDILDIPVYLNGNATLTGLTYIIIPLDLNSQTLTPVAFIPSAGYSLSGSISYSNGVETVPLQGQNITLSEETQIGILRCVVYLSDTLTTQISLEASTITSDDPRCLSLTSSGTITVGLQGCADSLLLAAMSGKPLFTVESIQPNPAANLLQVNFSNPTSAAISYQIIDALGQTRLNGMTSGAALSLDVSSLPAGIYFIRAISENGYSVSSKLAIVR